MRYFIICACLLTFPTLSVAQVEITEIMYDLEGSDANGEWIEVYNDGADVDLTTWRFFENETNHKIEAIGPTAISGGSYAVIADDPTYFSTLFPSYSGLLFKSSFSLHNEGERLEMRNGDLETQDSVTYTSSWGALGTGESLQRSGGSWFASVPTPGASSGTGNSQEGGDDERDNTGTTQVPSLTPSGGSKEENTISTQKTLKPSLTADAGPDRRVLVGTEVEFQGDAVNEKGVSEDGVEFGWNFGDGTIAEGRVGSHIYHDPGRYMATLYVYEKFMDMRDIDQAIIEVVEPEIEIVEVSHSDGTIRVTNNSRDDVDISGWQVAVGGSRYTLADFTHVLAGATVTLRISDVPLGRGDAALVLPSGRYVYTESVKTPVVSVQPQPVVQKEVSIIETVEDEEDIELSSASYVASAHVAQENIRELDEEDGSLGVWLLVIAVLGLVGGVSVVAIRKEGEVV